MRSPLFIGLLLCIQTFFLSAQPTLGLIQYQEASIEGYTLFSNNRETYLIDNCGLIVNQWSSEYRPGRSYYLLEDGSLLRTAELDGAFPVSGRGGRFELFSWEGELLWSYEINTSRLQAHHDIEPLPNGNFLCLIWENLNAQEALELGAEDEAGRWSEAIFEIAILPNNQAEIVWEWYLKDHLIQDALPASPNFGNVSETPERIDINYRENPDELDANWVHLNAIDYNEEKDHILVSSRLFSEVWIIDHSTSTVEASSSSGGASQRGGDILYRFGNPAAYNGLGDRHLFFQHDAQWFITPEGSPAIVVFNNQYDHDASAITYWNISFDAIGQYLSEQVFLQNSDTVHHLQTQPPFHSEFMSSVQALPNNHLFICEGMEGRFLELNATGEIVWEYINPVNNQGGPGAQGASPRFNQTFKATKYLPSFPGFQNYLLEGDLPVEINPTPNDCFLPDLPMPDQELTIDILPNFSSGSTWVDGNNEESIPFDCYNAFGQHMFSSSLPQEGLWIAIDQYPAGLYYMVFDQGRKGRITKPLIKV